MNKEELVQEISKKANVTQKEATEVLSSLITIPFIVIFLKNLPVDAKR